MKKESLLQRKSTWIVLAVAGILVLLCAIVAALYSSGQPATPIEITRVVERTVLVTVPAIKEEMTRIIEVTRVVTATPPRETATPAGPTGTSGPTSTPAPTQDRTKADKSAGFYLVGQDIAPGVWRNDGSSDGCYWAITSKTGDILSNHFGMGGGTMFVDPGGFQVELSAECGTWTYIGQ